MAYITSDSLNGSAKMAPIRVKKIELCVQNSLGHEIYIQANPIHKSHHIKLPSSSNWNWRASHAQFFYEVNETKIKDRPVHHIELRIENRLGHAILIEVKPIGLLQNLNLSSGIASIWHTAQVRFLHEPEKSAITEFPDLPANLTTSSSMTTISSATLLSGLNNLHRGEKEKIELFVELPLLKGSKIHLRMSATKKFDKFFRAAEDKWKDKVLLPRYFFDGIRISGDDTPQSLGIGNGDLIEAYEIMDGGGGNESIKSEQIKEEGAKNEERRFVLLPTPQGPRYQHTIDSGQPQTSENKVKDDIGHELHFDIDPDTELLKVFRKCEEKWEKSNLRFFFDGARLTADDTPAKVEMENGDIIEAHMEMYGGR